MPPHAHGGGEEEEVIVVRTDGPPFADIKAKPGQGFEMDFDRVQKFLGPGKLTLADFQRDIDAINKVYVPTAHRSFVFLRAGSYLMLGAFAAFIVMGVIGGTPEIRGVVVPILFLAFVAGLLSFWYSKWIEQPGIKQGAVLAKKLLDEEINPRYSDSQYRIRWTIRVRIQARSTIHLGKTFVERPVLTIWALRSHNDSGALVDWPLPELVTRHIMVERDSGKPSKPASHDGW